MNQHADTLADYPYEAHVVELETNQLPTRKNCCQIRKNNRVLSGNWRRQILEEIRIETSKNGGNKQNVLASMPGRNLMGKNEEN
jgi:hypothetical protein